MSLLNAVFGGGLGARATAVSAGRPMPTPQPQPQLPPQAMRAIQAQGRDPKEFTMSGSNLILNRAPSAGPSGPTRPMPQPQAPMAPQMSAAPERKVLSPEEVMLKRQVAFHAMGPKQPVVSADGVIYATGHEHDQALHNLMNFQAHQAGMEHSAAQSHALHAQAQATEAGQNVFNDPQRRLMYLMSKGIPFEEAQAAESHMATLRPGAGMMPGQINGGNLGAYTQSPEGAFLRPYFNPQKPEVGKGTPAVDMYRGMQSQNIPALSNPASPQAQAAGQLFRQRFPEGVEPEQDPSDWSVLKSLFMSPIIGAGVLTGSDPIGYYRKRHADSIALQQWLDAINRNAQPQPAAPGMAASY